MKGPGESVGPQEVEGGEHTKNDVLAQSGVERKETKELLSARLIIYERGLDGKSDRSNRRKIR